VYAQGVSGDDDILVRVDKPVVDEINAQAITAFGMGIGYFVWGTRDVAGAEHAAGLLRDPMEEDAVAWQDAAGDAAAPDISHRFAGGDTFGSGGSLTDWLPGRVRRPLRVKPLVPVACTGNTPTCRPTLLNGSG